MHRMAIVTHPVSGFCAPSANPMMRRKVIMAFVESPGKNVAKIGSTTKIEIGSAIAKAVFIFFGIRQ